MLGAVIPSSLVHFLVKAVHLVFWSHPTLTACFVT
jgi:hypothetical protein